MDALVRAQKILFDLIAYETVSSDSNLEMIGRLNRDLEAIGAEVTLTLDESGAKANLFATIGPDVDGGIVLSGHTDVVPVTGQEWTSEPFAPILRDGRVYGRGTCDMKGFIACAMALAPQFAAMGLKRPLHLAFTYDEEVGCLGAQVMLAALRKSGRRPSVCIIGEPTEMRIIEGHKGCCEYTTRFEGLEGHASQPDKGVNAIDYAVRYIGKLQEIADRLRERAPEGSPFDPPWTTVQVGRIEGGIARNVIAKACAVEWEMRPVQRSDFDFAHGEIRHYVEQHLLPAMRAGYSSAAITTETIGEVAGLEPVAESQAIEIVRALTASNAAPDVVSFSTEAGLYQEMGISTVVCGPGSIAQAHKPDEYIAIDQMAACLKMLEGLGSRLMA